MQQTEIGKNIRELRKKKGLTQDELAKKLFVTRQTISNYENGSTKPDPDMITRLAEALDTDANAMFYGEAGLNAEDPPLLIPTETPPSLTRKSLLSVVLSTLTLLVLSIASLILYRVGVDLRSEHYMAGPLMLVKLFLIPVTLVVLGWWIALMVENIFHLFVSRRPWHGKVRLGLVILLALCFVFHLPYLIWFICTTVEHLLTGNVIVTSQFPYIPVFQQIAYALMAVTNHAPFIYMLFGMLLRLFKRPHSSL